MLKLTLSSQKDLAGTHWPYLLEVSGVRML